MPVYTSDGAYRTVAAKAGSKSAASKPLTLHGVNVKRYTLTDTERAAFLALVPVPGDDDTAPKSLAEVQREFLAGIERVTPIDGRVNVTTEALAEFQSRMLALAAGVPATARTLALASFASGVILLADTARDDTGSVIDSLFPDPEPEPTPAPKK